MEKLQRRPAIWMDGLLEEWTRLESMAVFGASDVCDLGGSSSNVRYTRRDWLRRLMDGWEGWRQGALYVRDKM